MESEEIVYNWFVISAKQTSVYWYRK